MRAKGMVGKGQGWHKQSVRHSNARRTGKAGGDYRTTLLNRANPRYKTELIKSGKKYQITKTYPVDNEKNSWYSVEKKRFLANQDISSPINKRKAERLFKKLEYHKDMSYQQLKKAGVNLKPSADADKDGVPNSLDCRPLNKKKQDVSKKEELLR